MITYSASKEQNQRLKWNIHLYLLPEEREFALKKFQESLSKEAQHKANNVTKEEIHFHWFIFAVIIWAQIILGIFLHALYLTWESTQYLFIPFTLSIPWMIFQLVKWNKITKRNNEEIAKIVVEEKIEEIKKRTITLVSSSTDGLRLKSSIEDIYSVYIESLDEMQKDFPEAYQLVRWYPQLLNGSLYDMNAFRNLEIIRFITQIQNLPEDIFGSVELRRKLYPKMIILTEALAAQTLWTRPGTLTSVDLEKTLDFEMSAPEKTLKNQLDEKLLISQRAVAAASIEVNQVIADILEKYTKAQTKKLETYVGEQPQLVKAKLPTKVEHSPAKRKIIL